MTACAAATPIPALSRPARGAVQLPVDADVEAAKSQRPAGPGTAAGAPPAAATEAERDKTALSLALSLAGLVGVMVAGAVAMVLIAGLGPDAVEGDEPEAPHAVAGLDDAR